MIRVDGLVQPTPARTADDDGALPLLRTKLHRPVTSPGVEARVRLLSRLNGHEHRALTLISAPAGYGKTTLASVWLNGIAGPTGWISLDERDDDLLIFTSYLVAAAHSAFPQAAFTTQTLLQAPVPPSASTIARYLANDLEQTGARFTLALDDAHLLRDPGIFDLLAELLRYPLPSLHLVLIGRRDPPLPVATLRGRGQVVEIRARDLQFTVPETASLLMRMLGRDVDAAMAARWTERTEGWVTALRLVALSLLQRHDADDLGPDAASSPRFVQEYLLADVLAHLPEATRGWLLRTAALDRFCAPLCDAVCAANSGHDTLNGRAFIRWLQVDNLFLVPLDDEGRWFRFHHLFRDLLRELLAEQVTKAERLALYRRASAWFAANGLPDEAVRYALDGNDPAFAVRLVEQGRYELMNAAQWTRLERWLKLLPADQVNASALLTNAQAFLAVHRGEESETLAAVQRSLALLAAAADCDDTRVARAELDALSYLPHFIAGRFDLAVDDARRSLRTLPANAYFVRSLAASIEASALHLGGKPQEALEVLNRALSVPMWPPVMRVRLLYYLCTEQYLSGNLRGVLAAAAECVAGAVELRQPELAAWGLYYLGAAHYARNDFDAAEPHLEALLENRALAGPVTLAFGVFALALIRQARGRQAEADELLESLAAYLRRIEHKLAASLSTTFATELALRAGQPAETLAAPPPGFAARLPRWYFYAPQLTEIKLLLADGGAANLATAQRVLTEFEDEVRRYGVTHTRIDVLALQALAFQAQGEQARALDCLDEAIRLAELGGFVRSFIDLGAPMAELLVCLQQHCHGRSPAAAAHLERVIDALPHQARAIAAPLPGLVNPAPARGHAGLLEPLTEREEQLLRLLASDLSPVEIADRLSLSPTTVRTHFRNIYAKLDAHSRYEAVMRAKELGLL